MSVKEQSPANGGLYQTEVTIAYPEANFSADIPAVLTTIFGKLSLDGKVKLVDIEFSERFKSCLPGPVFGIEGYERK